jgi:tetratricopeptide (TPR) repeat protein
MMRISEEMKHYGKSTRLLGLLAVLMLVVGLVLAIGFGAYYYYDRYVHVGDMSPVELNLTHLQASIKSNPDSLGARLSLAQQYLEMSNYNAAIEQTQWVLAKEADNPGALLLAGMAYSESGNYEASNQALERFVKLRRDSDQPVIDKVLEDSLFYLGNNYLALELPAKAIEYYQQALQIDHTDADALYQLGLAQARMGGNTAQEQAVQSYLKAVAFAPDFQEAYHALADSYAALGRGPQADYAKGMEAYCRKDYSRARQYLENASRQLPDFAPIFLGLAMVYEKTGEVKLAYDNARHVLQFEPGNILAASILARLK